MIDRQTFGVQFVVRKNKEKVKNLTIFARIILDQVRTRFNNIYQELMIDGDLPTVAMVKNHFLGIEEQGKSILDAFEYQISCLG